MTSHLQTAAGALKHPISQLPVEHISSVDPPMLGERPAIELTPRVHAGLEQPPAPP